MTPRIAVVGAGPGGLTCARVLQMNHVDVTVLEQEQAPDSRAQGGSLDLHADSGQVALKAAGLYDQFMALARPEGQESRLVDPVTAELVRHEMPDGDFKPEIDRGQLRTLLLDSLAEGTVQWGRAVRAVGPTGEILFADNTKNRYDLVIGADGAWSRVRAAGQTV
ncbi:FAD-dependent oxidoreductase [Kibdelosporangium lantanae]|uniref:FAD-dependent oxidoreductase n=1 Tax=Kibdelosporangium lantanae TaxID=1497396 RepID=A0ABW3M3Z1_9PSEU